MKTLNYFMISTFALIMAEVNGQIRTNPDFPDRLPANLKTDNSQKRAYRITTDYMNYDLKGNFRTKTRITGEYYCGLPGDSVRWNNICIAQSNERDGSFPECKKQCFMENFSYIPDENVVSETFFKNVPQANIFIKNLIWDISGLNWFAYRNWDKLELNKTYKDEEVNSQEIGLAGSGTFENRNVEVCWIGVTRMNDEMCAIIKYSTMNNPVKINLEDLTMDGQGHYWGEIYVSLSDKEIEFATLSEDVITDLKIKGQPKNILGYTVRKINLSRIQ